MLADYRKVYPFGVEHRGEPDEVTGQWPVTEADVLTDGLQRLDDKLDRKGLDPRTVIEIRAKMAAIKALLNGDGKDQGPLLSALFDQWRAERKPTPKTWLEFRRALEGFVEVCGDLPVRAIKKEHVRTWKSALLNSLSKRGKNEGTIKVATAQKLLNTLRSVLEYATREGIIDSNPAHGVSRIAAIRQQAAVEAPRLPYTVEQVRTIFEKVEQEDDERIKWIVKLAFWRGCRLSEFVGARPQDVREEDGVRFLSIEVHEGRGLKNRSSIRKIPLAAAVHDLPVALLPFGKGHYWSKRVNGWLKEHISDDPRLTLHSARHSFKDACRRAGLSEEVHDALTGHSNGSVSCSYGRGVPLKVMQEAISRLSY